MPAEALERSEAGFSRKISKQPAVTLAAGFVFRRRLNELARGNLKDVPELYALPPPGHFHDILGVAPFQRVPGQVSDLRGFAERPEAFELEPSGLAITIEIVAQRAVSPQSVVRDCTLRGRMQ